MSEFTIEQSAKEAATMGPLIRTPRWLWAWMFAVAVLVMLFLARKILGPFIFAAIFAYIFSPIIDNLQERLRWPRGLVVGLFYVLVLGAIGIGLYFGAEALVKETQALARQGPNIVESALVQVMGDKPFEFAGQLFTPATLSERINEGLSTYFENGEAIHFIGEMVIRILDTILVIMVSLYLLLDGKRLWSLPPQVRARRVALPHWLRRRANTHRAGHLPARAALPHRHHVACIVPGVAIRLQRAIRPPARHHDGLPGDNTLTRPGNRGWYSWPGRPFSTRPGSRSRGSHSLHHTAPA